MERVVFGWGGELRDLSLVAGCEREGTNQNNQGRDAAAHLGAFFGCDHKILDCAGL